MFLFGLLEFKQMLNMLCIRVRIYQHVYTNAQYRFLALDDFYPKEILKSLFCWCLVVGIGFQTPCLARKFRYCIKMITLKLLDE